VSSTAAHDLEPLRQEMRSYYETMRHDRIEANARAARLREEIWRAMEEFLAENPDAAPWTLKTRLHGEIADRFEPVLFPHSPFFWEMGLRPSENWGIPQRRHAGTWLFEKRFALAAGHPAYANIRAFGFGEGDLAIARESTFDADHHCLGYSRLLKVGLDGLVDDIDERLEGDVTGEQWDCLHAMRESCVRLCRIAAKFASAAEALWCTTDEPQVRRFMAMVARTARHVPGNPPRTFYEGLAALWFLREAVATLEAVGISVVGHLDRLLIDLYRADLAAGRLTEAEARDLLARWMLPTDVKFHVEENPWPETSTCMTLGGCDADGRCVFNELTRLILDVHAEMGLLNPKPNCRYSPASPPQWLDLLGGQVLAGRNVFALVNDDVLIPACVQAGKSEPEARLYVNGGCQETICEGVEHSAGAYYYFNMPRVLDLCLQPPAASPLRRPGDAEAAAPHVIIDAADFEDFYGQFLAALKRAIAAGAEWRRAVTARWTEIHPCPLLSATLEGCIESARDYTAGGARHNPAGIALVGLATVVDSLHAVRRAVFEQRWLSLEELRGVLADDWRGREPLRARMIGLGKFGCGDEEADALAGRFAGDLAAFVPTLTNERGGHFQASFFVYYQFADMAPRVRATPDGRRSGELLSQGVAPGRLRAPPSLTDVFRGLSRIDMRGFPANAVLDAQLPAGGGMTPGLFSAVLRTFANLGGATLQPNVVSVEALRRAQERPDEHRDLVVRIAGLSARFVTLRRDVQNEVIRRHLLA